MNPPTSIRQATEKDARALSGLIRRNADAVLSAHYSREQLSAWKRFNTPARIRQRLPERTTFCAFRAGRLCATIGLEGSELVGLYVSRTSRGQGLGKLLLAHLESVAATQGLTRLHLTSTPAALDFYLRNGWRCGKTVVLKIFGVDFEETFMSKRLTQRNRKTKTSPRRK